MNRPEDASSPEESALMRRTPADGTALPVGAAEIAAAMTLQAEVLKRLAQTQTELQAALKEERRGELVIQSTRALNESFRGMQKTQEALLQELHSERNKPKYVLLASVLGAILLIAAIAVAAVHLGDRVDHASRELSAEVLDQRSSAAFEELARLTSRVTGLEDKDRALFESELRTLRERVGALAEERARIITERDRLNDERGNLMARISLAETRAAAADAKVADAEARRADAETSAERLTRARLADQELVQNLNETIRRLEMRLAAGATTSGGERPVAPVPAVATEQGAERPAAEVTPVAAPEVRAVDELRAELNDLLRQHRSTHRYVIESMQSHDQEGLRGVELREYGPDGSLVKTVVAERLRFQLGRTGRTLNLAFQTGHVVLRQGGKDLKSPFFRDSYDIVVFAVQPEPWVKAGLPFPVSAP